MEALVLVGSVVGIIVGWGLSQLSERWRWRREDRTRFAESRRELYARFLVEATVIYEEIRAAAERPPTTPRGSEAAATAETLVGAHRKLRQSEIEIRLLAGHTLVASAAADLREVTAFAMGLLTEHKNPADTGSGWVRTEERWGEAIAAYERSAREDLDVDR